MKKQTQILVDSNKLHILATSKFLLSGGRIPAQCVASSGFFLYPKVCNSQYAVFAPCGSCNGYPSLHCKTLTTGSGYRFFIIRKSKKYSIMFNSNESAMVEAFQFSATRQELRSVVINQEPWVVAKDVCDILGIINHKDAIKALDEDEVGKTYLGVQTGVKRDGTPAIQKVKVNVINESGLYTLIFRSNKPEAKVFRKWVTSEVLPTLRKKGYYAMGKQKQRDFIDARAMPYEERELNGFNIRYINIEGEMWFSVNDIHRAIGSATGSNQSVKKLNAVETLAIKIHLFGNTHPAWFTNSLGFQLLLSGSRVLRDNRQLSLTFATEGSAK